MRGQKRRSQQVALAVGENKDMNIEAKFADLEIEDQARRLDLFLGHAGNSRDIISDLETGEFGFDVHVLVLRYHQANLSR